MFKTILGPLDGSKLGECTLEYIKDVAIGCHVSDVVLLTVLEPVTNPDFYSGESRSAWESMTKQQEKAEKDNRQKAEDYLGKAAETLKKEGITVKTAVLPHKSGLGAADGILDYAKKNKVDLIVMSTHGRSGISRWAMGSVADRVVNYATTPVLTVTPAGCRVSD